MRYLSLFSGIEAASAAWHDLGWTPVGFSEIEPFPCAVLAHRFPNVRNYGDVTKYKEWDIQPGSVDVVVGGSPCQAFSVAGLRRGLDDPRGNLTLTYLGVVAHLRPRWVVWENVPGVLSIDGGRVLGAFLGALGQLGYRWAYRVLDAQHFGVPQRRRRIFVVASLGDGAHPGSVLFEPESLRGNPAKGHKARKGSAATAGAGVDECGLQRTVGTLCADTHPGAYSGQDAYTGRLIPHATDLVCAASPVRTPHSVVAFAQNTRDEVRLIGGDGQTVGALAAQPGMKQTTYLAVPAVVCATGSMTHALRAEGADASEDGTGRGTPIVPVAFAQNQLGEVRVGSVTNTLNTNSNASGRNTPMIAFHPTQDPIWSADRTHALSTGSSGGHASITVATAMQVRRLTCTEAERLQGFPDGWTAIPYRGKPAADGPRYKALGNSMAVPVMRWIGQRIQLIGGGS